MRTWKDLPHSVKEKKTKGILMSNHFLCTRTIRDGFTGGNPQTPIALARGGAGGGGVLFFMIKQNIIRDKMRYSNLSNGIVAISYYKLIAWLFGRLVIK